jgi:hypothetical protein
MKTKKFEKKLALNKQTVSNLNKSQMNGINGAGPTTNITCEFCDTVVSCEETLCPICVSNPDTLCTACLPTEMCTTLETCNFSCNCN